MANVLESLKITTWYKALTAVSAAAFLIALTAQRDVLTFLFGGILLASVGEWVNHPTKEFSLRKTPVGFAKVSDVPRKFTFFGTSLQLVGLGLIALSVFNLLR